MAFETRNLGGEHIMNIDPRAEASRDVKPVTVDEVRSAPKPADLSADTVRSALKPAEPPADAVKLSDTLKLADHAVRAAAASGDVRPEAVARARQLLESGLIGANPDAIAERIIDSLLESRDTRT